MTSTKLGITIPVASDAADLATIFSTLIQSIDDLGGISGIFTTTQRNALAGGNLYNGRLIWNSTNARLEVYKGATLTWQPVGAGDLVTAVGDTIYASAAGVLARLAIGATSQVMRVNGGLPSWADLVLSVGHTWTVVAPGVPSGATNFINPKRVRVPSGMTAKLVRCDSAIRAGTSVTFDVKKASTVAGITAGTNLTGFTAQSAIPGGATVAPTAVTLVDGDYIAPVPSAVSGTPDNFTVDLLIAYQYAG